jgi:hypothetical protein
VRVVPFGPIGIRQEVLVVEQLLRQCAIWQAVLGVARYLLEQLEMALVEPLLTDSATGIQHFLHQLLGGDGGTSVVGCSR